MIVIGFYYLGPGAQTGPPSAANAPTGPGVNTALLLCFLKFLLFLRSSHVHMFLWILEP
jgi:hypothetical protein